MADRPTPERLAEIRAMDKVGVFATNPSTQRRLKRTGGRPQHEVEELSSCVMELLAEVDALRAERDEVRRAAVEAFVISMEIDASMATPRSMDHAEGVEWVLRRARTRADMPPRKKAT